MKYLLTRYPLEIYPSDDKLILEALQKLHNHLIKIRTVTALHIILSDCKQNYYSDCKLEIDLDKLSKLLTNYVKKIFKNSYITFSKVIFYLTSGFFAYVDLLLLTRKLSIYLFFI